MEQDKLTEALRLLKEMTYTLCCYEVTPKESEKIDKALKFLKDNNAE